ncbi:hypothetical protein J1P26_16655 [Neobacillus sp. MM2021_6]|uniref:hypothetical protein n=1 Tax=Bacillaceae TaxID=186817 RepID=UPI00140B8C57|nr:MULTISPECIES: hypothetical protein [Bacillaceae]MBO0961337.1 hypothetical protein [Neobacillus sp. MM2021_6]NHC18770.1 hypothetical protein [Bacillus sp. MM2020_4]WML38658.1 hypothetical protein RCG19_15825 [Neobacillus sp. OS1-2]
MKSVAVTLFIVSAILFLGSSKYLFDLKRPGVYPPKQIIKKRAAALAGVGGIFLLVALLLSIIS